MEHKTVSLADQVFERLEQDILSGKYAKGELLTELRLSGELGVSRTPIREALRRLEQAHIVEDSSKGAVVLGITPDDLMDIMEVRLRLEGIAAARAAARITEEEIRKLRETVDLQEFYLHKSDSEQIKTMDSQFHTLVYLYSGSTVLYDTLTPLHKKVQRFRKAAVENVGRAEESVEEHRAVLEAICAHDAAEAEKRMLQHTQNARDNLKNKYALPNSADTAPQSKEKKD